MQKNNFKSIKIKCILVKISEEDFDLINKYKWCLSSNKKYFRTHINFNNKRHSVPMHRLIMGCNPNDGSNIDHINRDTFDNRKSNLRFANQLIQNLNHNKYKNKSSKYRGVTFNKQNSKWTAHISKNKIQYHLGYFNTELDAANAYNKKSLNMFGDLAPLNKIPNKKYKEKNRKFKTSKYKNIYKYKNRFYIRFMRNGKKYQNFGGFISEEKANEHLKSIRMCGLLHQGMFRQK